MTEFNLSFIDTIQYWLNNTNIFDLLLKGVFLYITIFWFALIIWVTRDVIHRSNNVLFQAFVILLNTFLPIFGLVIYLLIRPQKTLIDKYYDELEYKALSFEKFCPKCSINVQEDFEYCPECGESLKNSCLSCKKHSFKVYEICPYCGEKKKAEKSKAKKRKPKK